MIRNIGVKYQRGFWNFVIPAVAAVGSALLSKKSSDKSVESQQASYDAQLAYQREADEANRQSTLEMNKANLEAQKEFAQHGISWKVADSKAAGLHPLFGAGLSGTSFSPSFQVAQRTPAPGPRPVAGPDNYNWLAQLGQLMGNYFGREEAKKAQFDTALGDSDQRVSITEYPGGGRTIVTPIRGLESQVSGRPLDAPMYNEALGEGWISPRRLPDPYGKSHIVEAPDKAGPFWQRFSFGEKFQVILPKTSEPQEVFEDKPLWFWAMVAKANVNEYGMGWLTKARSQFPSLRQVYDGVVQELSASGIIPKSWR